MTIWAAAKPDGHPGAADAIFVASTAAVGLISPTALIISSPTPNTPRAEFGGATGGGPGDLSAGKYREIFLNAAKTRLLRHSLPIGKLQKR